MAEQWNIDTDGLRVGGKLWNGTRGWFVIVRIAIGKVWVRPQRDREDERGRG